MRSDEYSLGPIIGGAFTDSKAGWRWAFYINICIGGLLAPIYVFYIPSHSPHKDESMIRRIRQLDILGITLFVGAFTAGVMAISFGGALCPWSSACIIVLFCCSAILWVMFGIQQTVPVYTTSESRILPLHLLKVGEIWIFFTQTATSITGLFLPVYFIPLYFQFVHTDSALEAGVRLLPYICVGVAFCLANGGLMGKFGYYMPWYIAGSTLVVIGAALMRTVDLTTSVSTVYGYSVILGAGVGAYVQASFPVAQTKFREDQGPQVLALMGCAQLSGLAISFSVANAVFLNRATNLIGNALPGISRSKVQATISGSTSQVFSNLSDRARKQQSSRPYRRRPAICVIRC